MTVLRKAVPHRTATILIGLVTASLVIAVIWSLWAELDQISRARGQVIPSGRVQVIQSLDGGEITEILVREGDRVRRGQTLVVLDKIKLTAAVDEARARVAAFKSAMARIQAELQDRPLVFPADVLPYRDFVANQRALYTNRRAALNAELNGIESQRRLQQQELGLNRPLVATGDVAQSELIRMERAAAELSTLASVRRGRYLQELQAEYTKTQEDLVTAEQVLAQRVDALENAEFVAPTDGIVKNIRLTTVGAVLRPGDEVMTIVPTGEELIVEAKVSPTDIAFVQVGQTATIKFDAYDSGIYGSGTGRVTFISPDTLVEARSDGREEPYYRVHLRVNTSGIRPVRAGERIEIQPGMVTTVEIKTGESTVFRYLTNPVLKGASDALEER